MVVGKGQVLEIVPLVVVVNGTFCVVVVMMVTVMVMEMIIRILTTLDPGRLPKAMSNRA